MSTKRSVLTALLLLGAALLSTSGLTATATAAAHAASLRNGRVRSARTGRALTESAISAKQARAFRRHFGVEAQLEYKLIQRENEERRLFGPFHLRTDWMRAANPYYRMRATSLLAPGSPRLWDRDKVARGGKMEPTVVELARIYHEDVGFFGAELRPWNGRAPREAAFELPPFRDHHISMEVLLVVERHQISSLGYRYYTFNAAGERVKSPALAQRPSELDPGQAWGILSIRQEGRGWRLTYTWYPDGSRPPTSDLPRTGQLTDPKGAVLEVERRVADQLVDEGHHFEARPPTGEGRSPEGVLTFDDNLVTESVRATIEVKQLRAGAKWKTIFNRVCRSMRNGGQSPHMVIDLLDTALGPDDVARAVQAILEDRLQKNWKQYRGRLHEIRFIGNAFDHTYVIRRIDDAELASPPPDLVPLLDEPGEL